MPMVRVSNSRMPATTAFRSIARGCKCWRREKASSCSVSLAPCSAARCAAARCRVATASPSRRGTSNSRLPMIAVNRLLKSCAMPPVRWTDGLHFLRLAQLLLHRLARGKVARRRHDQPVALVLLGHADEHHVDRAGHAGHRAPRRVTLVLAGADAGLEQMIGSCACSTPRISSSRRPITCSRDKP